MLGASTVGIDRGAECEAVYMGAGREHGAFVCDGALELLGARAEIVL